ncbi:MAG: family transcriptional regulator, anaerobic regulatory protein, partial [Pseudomonadota bacterium]|nr:family transcriptional regulator, anaerobic regulatory protein [Pseudomonadota bacterium]
MNPIRAVKAAPLYDETAGPCRHKPENLRCASCILDDSGFFSGLSLDAKLDLQKCMQFATVGKRSCIYAEGNPSDHLYILVSGEVKVYKSLIDGRQQIHKIVSIPGDLLACEDMFLDSHNSTAVTLDETKVCYLKKSSLMELMNQHRE